MLQTSYITVIIGVLVPTAALIAVVIRVCVVRSANSAAAAAGGGYSQVQHSLDEEEIEFKRIFERQSDNIDDMFGDEAGSSDMVFDDRDLDRLNMLEKYRDSLVSGVTDEADDGAVNQSTPLTAETDEIRV